MRSNFAPLRLSAYRRLLFSYVVNEFGDSVALVALSVLVYDESGSAFATAMLFIAARFLPAFAAPVLTARLDQLRAGRVLGALYAAEAAIFTVLAVLAIYYWLPAVLLLALLDGTLALTARAVSRGTVAVVLEETGLLREGNALMNVGFGLAMVLGTLAGGVLVASLGPGAGLAIDAASFAVVAVAIVGLQVANPAYADQHARVLERLSEGLRHVRGHAVLPLLLAGEALALVCFYLVIPIEVIYAKETLDTGDAGFGLLLGAWSTGVLLGSLAYVRLSRRSPVALLLGSTVAVGAAYAGMALTTELWVACAFSVLGGVGNGFQWVSVMTMLQEATPTHLQARVVGLLESIGAAMPGVGFLLGGILAAVWSPQLAYGVAGIGVLLVAAAGAALLPPRVKGRSTELPEGGLPHVADHASVVDVP